MSIVMNGKCICTHGKQNLTAAERVMIVELVEKYWHLVEDKKTDSTSLKVKSEAWDQIAVQFNSISSTKRMVQQLKQVLLDSVSFMKSMHIKLLSFLCSYQYKMQGDRLFYLGYRFS